MNDSGAAEAIAASLTTERFGRTVRHFPVAVTTESLAIAWARKEDAPEGATVVADQELSPRQRKGPPWIGIPGKGLYCAVVLRPGIPPDAEGLLWLLASLGAAEGLEQATGLPVTVKWPDDLLVDGRKFGGLKIDAVLGPGKILFAVVTYRVNVNVEPGDFPPSISDFATSVLMETGGPVERERVLDGILGGLERRYESAVSDLLDSYRARCETIGRNVRALLLPRGEVMGRVSGIDDFGALLVDVGGKPTPIVVPILKKLEPV